MIIDINNKPLGFCGKRFGVKAINPVRLFNVGWETKRNFKVTKSFLDVFKCRPRNMY